MKKKEAIILIAIMCVVGTCMHFVCDIITNDIAVKILGVIFPINETSFEHMKMIWYPFLGASIYYAISRKSIKKIGGFIIAGFVAMPIQLGLFAFYQSFFGKSVLALDIIFYMADMILCAIWAIKMSEEAWCIKTWYLWLALAIIITAGIITLTYCPGKGYVFQDDNDFEGLIAMLKA